MILQNEFGRVNLRLMVPPSRSALVVSDRVEQPSPGRYLNGYIQQQQLHITGVSKHIAPAVSLVARTTPSNLDFSL
jgi:hypothetical protein